MRSQHANPGTGSPATEVEIIDASGAVSASARGWLREHALRAVGVLGATGEVRVRIVRDGPMAEAHARYSGVEGTTDVLTFDMSEGSGGATRTLDLDVLVCVDEAGRQARDRGHDPAREMLLYIVHAVLHALGHDDHDEAPALEMHREEDRVLSEIGVGPTYSREPGAGVRP